MDKINLDVGPKKSFIFSFSHGRGLVEIIMNFSDGGYRLCGTVMPGAGLLSVVEEFEGRNVDN